MLLRAGALLSVSSGVQLSLHGGVTKLGAGSLLRGVLLPRGGGGLLPAGALVSTPSRGGVMALTY